MASLRPAPPRPGGGGIARFTVGFFGSHTIASNWGGRRAQQGHDQASALYLCAYYLGGSIAGRLRRLFWADYGRPGVARLVGCLLVGLLAVGAGLAFLPPRPMAEPRR